MKGRGEGQRRKKETAEASVWSEVREGSQGKECRWPPEAREEKGTAFRDEPALLTP